MLAVVCDLAAEVDAEGTAGQGVHEGEAPRAAAKACLVALVLLDPLPRLLLVLYLILKLFLLGLELLLLLLRLGVDLLVPIEQVERVGVLVSGTRRRVLASLCRCSGRRLRAP